MATVFTSNFHFPAKPMPYPARSMASSQAIPFASESHGERLGMSDRLSGPGLNPRLLETLERRIAQAICEGPLIVTGDAPSLSRKDLWNE